MRTACRRACGQCDPKCANRDKSGACDHWASLGECEKNPTFMHKSCKRACGLCPGGLGLARVFSRGGSGADGDGGEWSHSCQDRSSFCGQWAAVGECDSNPHYMKSMCKVTCHLCQSRACHDVDAPRCRAEAAARRRCLLYTSPSPRDS